MQNDPIETRASHENPQCWNPSRPKSLETVPAIIIDSPELLLSELSQRKAWLTCLTFSVGRPFAAISTIARATAGGSHKIAKAAALIFASSMFLRVFPSLLSNGMESNRTWAGVYAMFGLCAVLSALLHHFRSLVATGMSRILWGVDSETLRLVFRHLATVLQFWSWVDGNAIGDSTSMSVKNNE